MIKKYLKNGDSIYFETIVERYEKYAYIYAFSILNNEFDSQDVVAESFLKVFTKLKQYQMGSNFKNWFLKIVHNTCFDLLRKNEKFVYFDDFEKSVNLFYDSTHCYDNIDTLDFGELKEKLNLLPHEIKSVIILRYYYDWDYKSISNLLNIPIGTLSSRINRGCKKLKKIIEKG